MKKSEYAMWYQGIFASLCEKPATHIFEGRYLCSFHTKITNRWIDSVFAKTGVLKERPVKLGEQ